MLKLFISPGPHIYVSICMMMNTKGLFCHILEVSKAFSLSHNLGEFVDMFVFFFSFHVPKAF